MKPVRTRFAPSPTGFMHVGGVRTALFAWLLARKMNGQFLLRIEDTDKNREVDGSVQHIIDSLHWLDLQWDESVDIGGPYGPYLQSERLEQYKQWAEKLIAKDRAYADTRTPEQLDTLRHEAAVAKKPFLMRNHRPDNPPIWEIGMPLRFKSEPKAYQWNDAVMGDLRAGPEVVDDFIMIKSDGFPTYNFAHVVDDEDMKITHIMRGLEFMAGVPNYLNLYEALDIKPPVLAHLPQILGPDGRKKLGKRDGAKDLLDYAKEGYLPDAMLNFLVSMGWNDGTEQELFSREELIKKFSLERVQRSGARFDEKRLLWMNGHYIRELSIDALYEKTMTFWPVQAESADIALKKQILALIQERLKYFAEIPELTRFFFVDLATDRTEIAESDFSVEDLTNRLNGLLEKTRTKPGILFSLIRIASTEAPASPALAGTLAVLGKEISLRRIDTLLAEL
jgi:glutamyl-tRNA synthetase